MPSSLSDLWSAVREPLMTLLAQWGLKALAAIAVFFIGMVVARMLRRWARKNLGKTPVDTMLVPFLSGVIYFGTMLFVVLAALSIVQVPVTSFIAVLGAAGLAIALAFQSTLSNLASGIMLLTFRPFSPGDYVELTGTDGTVKEVGVFNTVLATKDNVRLVIPNAQIFDQVIKNYTFNDTRRIDLVVGVAYDDDLDLAGETIREILDAEERILDDPEPIVAVDELGGSSVNFVVRPWVKTSEYWPTRWALMKALKEGVEEAGLSFPFPQRDVHLFQENPPVKVKVADSDPEAA